MNDVDFTAGADSSHSGYAPQQHIAAVVAEDFPNGHGIREAHSRPAVGEHNPPAPAIRQASTKLKPPGLAFTPWTNHNGPLLALLADALDDIENIRKATSNRLRQLTRTGPDADGEERGFGLTLAMPQVAAVAAMLKAIKHDDAVLKDLGYDTTATGRPCGCLECQAIRNLQKEMRKHPLGPWVSAAVGVGEKQGARLIAAIGDPYWNTLHDRPRTLSELRSYCGLRQDGNGVAVRRRKGEDVNWSSKAKSRAWLVASKCMVVGLKKPCGKQGNDELVTHVDGCQCSHYRLVYDAGRAKYLGAVHQHECIRCGPSGKPALAGSPVSPGHQHARAIRLVMREVLKDLWLESKRLHEGT